ncbi:MAG: twin transmembrane helix small protein [Alphaproteobacteria bacterium]|nr:twin transmembrane helix small protein [Alphaproteobacteria bacterium]
MTQAFNILIPATILITFGILCFGIYALFRGGDFGRSWSNKAMRLRIVAQFVAILVLLGALWAKQHGLI